MNKNIIVFLLAFFQYMPAIGQDINPIYGPSPVELNQTKTYWYNSFAIIPFWEVTGGDIVSSTYTGNRHEVTIKWTTVGTGTIKLFNRSIWAGHINVIVNAPSVPPVPNTGIDIDNLCGKTKIHRYNNPPSYAQWHWQYSETGTSLFLGYSNVLEISTPKTVFLRAYNPSSGMWSTFSLEMGQIPVNPYPTAYILQASKTVYCQDELPISLILSGSEPNIEYSLLRNLTVVSTKTSSGGSLTWSGLTQAGQYKVMAINITTSCSKEMSNSLNITINPLPTVEAQTDQTLYLSNTMMLSGSPLGGTWSGFGVSGTMFAAQTAGVGVHVLTYSYTNNYGCTNSDTRTITVTSDAYITLNGSQQLGIGEKATFTVNGSFTTVQWRKNNTDIAGATENTYSTGDLGSFSAQVTSSTESILTTNSIVVRRKFASSDMNYIMHWIPVKPINGNVNTSENVDEVNRTVDYFDGLGRRIQQVGFQKSPSKKDLVTPIAYDEFSRETNQYLPYVTTAQNGLYKADALAHSTNTDPDPLIRYQSGAQYNFYQTATDIANDPSPYSERVFEPSPLNRVMEQGAPGAAWQPVEGNPTAGKTIKFGYEINTVEDKVYQWFINEADQWPSKAAEGGHYPTGELYKNITTDEEGNKVIEFIDKLQRTILKRVQAVESPNLTTYVAGEWADTYYIYDDFNNLRFVLPPEASKQAPASPSTAFLNQWAFQYKYDGRKRMVEKQVPGAGAVYMVYDNRDRLVLTQDSVQRAQDKWLFTKYDAFNRPVATGIYNSSLDQLAMQTAVNNYYANLTTNQAWYESMVTTGGVYNYDNKSFPQTPLAEDYLTVTYYDYYTVSDTWAMGYQDAQLTQTTNAIYSTEPTNFTRVKGQVTSSMVKNLDDNTWLKTVIYYDDRYRVIQTVASNHLGGIDRMSNLYDFVGKVLQTKTTHTDATDTNEILETYAYDHAGRLLEVMQQLNTEPEIVLLENDYNELGELIEKNLHSEDGGNSFAQSVDYRYNIRGWLTRINEADLSDGEGDLFGLEVGYNNDLQTGNSPRYNGDASGIKWSTNLGLADVKQRAYTYGYDVMNRLTSANHNSFIGGWQPVNPYGVTFDYNLNGNPTNLTRKNELGLNLDMLSYTYNGNQAMRITDAGDKAKGFRDGHTVANIDDYAYDGNGNLAEDKNKGILRYSYNYLNLPDTVEFEDNKMIVFAYDAVGIKLSQTNYENGVALTKRDYAAGYFYENDTLRYISNAEGRMVKEENGSFTYEYNISDHLENNWLTFTTKPKQWEFLATMEDANASYEEATFGYVPETRTPSTAANTTPGGSKAAQLDINQPVGPVLSLQVAAGDTISIEAYGYYEGGSGYSSTNNAAAMITAIAGAFGGVSGVAGEAGALFTGFEEALLDPNALTGTGDDNVPAAYLNFLLFDQDMVYKQGGFTQITTNANMSSELISFSSFVITQPGTIYIYCSNESVNGRVFFDDLKITHNEGPVVATNTYFPNGAPIAGLSFQRATTPVNRFKFIDREYVDDFGLELYDHLARYYDPHWGLGYTGVDVLADEFNSWSPYQYAYRNPARFVDKTGMAADDVIDPPEWLNDIGKGLAQLGSDIKEGVSDAVDATSGFISNAANSVVAALKEGDKAMDGGSGSTNTSKNFIGDDSSVREGTIEGETEVDQFILMPTPTNSPTKAIEAGAGLYEAFSNAMTIVESSKEIVGNKDPTQTPNPRDTVKTESGRYFIFKSGMQNGYLAKEPQNKNVPKVPRNGN